MIHKLMKTFIFLFMASNSFAAKSDQAKDENEGQVSAVLKIIERPIIFNKEREKLSLEYLQQRYAMVQNKATISPKMVVVHWTAIDSLEDSFRVFNTPRLPSSREKISSASALNVSAHFLIDRDGSIYQLLPETTFARHVIGLNHSAIGIENVGNGSDLPLTKEQLEANINLIKQLATRHPIEYVIGHFEYKQFIGHSLWKEKDPGYLTQKTDPGLSFIKKVRSGLSALQLKLLPLRESNH
ncbi:MAG: N-acetylmuramoyl-L-alanine amidase [Kangiellaceae bacterium]|nr:N-acetylmuramoyl-L-alanine amidase [Kangiellaceae bacterium]